MVTLEKYYRLTAQQEYEKNPKLSAADVKELINWSDKSIKLHGRLTDLQVIMFLHACGYDKEYTKKTIYQCFDLKSKKCFSFFSARDPAHVSIRNKLDAIDVNIIHDKDTDYSYLWAKLKTTEVSQYYPTTTGKVLFMAIDLDQIECGTISGYRMILDSNNFSLSHALRWSIFDLRNLMKYFQDGTNFILDKIYILNVNSGSEMLYSISKPFMSSSLKEKITMISVLKTNEFVKTLPQKIVPKDYGGLSSTTSELTKILENKLLTNREYFLEEEKFRNGYVKDEVNTN